jgi:hypothetical protein
MGPRLIRGGLSLARFAQPDGRPLATSRLRVVITAASPAGGDRGDDNQVGPRVRSGSGKSRSIDARRDTVDTRGSRHVPLDASIRVAQRLALPSRIGRRRPSDEMDGVPAADPTRGTFLDSRDAGPRRPHPGCRPPQILNVIPAVARGPVVERATEHRPRSGVTEGAEVGVGPPLPPGADPVVIGGGVVQAARGAGMLRGRAAVGAPAAATRCARGV